MRKAQKKQALDFVMLLGEAHDDIRRAAEKENPALAQELLEQCQEGAIRLGTLIERAEGQDCAVIPMLEDYCELIYRLHEEITVGQCPAGAEWKQLRRLLICIENSIRTDIAVRLEAVFLPYKASMWDSMESVWQAAELDEGFDVYVVPIPYYDKNPDGSLGRRHYEGADYPSDVSVVDYEDYNFEERRPDVIYIHNPYDYGNYVTTVEPRFYSDQLKQYTECLVYIPYYVSSGGMAEGQSWCPAYEHADYIIIQAESYRRFFHPSVPGKKLIPLGSPKLDRVLRMCREPGQPPENWRKKMEGRTVYFYNTSLGGALEDTEGFLKKMEYVFRCFDGRTDVCLVWRPHPLMESTLQSMRREWKPAYDGLKEAFIKKDIGLYDDTPDITRIISYCDVYLGDAASSVTALFGAAGKPIFLLNNQIHEEPGEGGWRDEIIHYFYPDGQEEWQVTQGNKLYYAPRHDYRYSYFCDLSEYEAGGYYARAIHVDGKIYVCPCRAQELLVIRENREIRRIGLEEKIWQGVAFRDIKRIGHYLYLIPSQYPAVVQYNMKNDEVKYIRGYYQVYAGWSEDGWKQGGYDVWQDYLLLSSPVDQRIWAIEGSTGKEQILTTGAKNEGGSGYVVCNGGEVWILPNKGVVLTCWKPITGEVREYEITLEKFQCWGIPFSWAIFYQDEVILSPLYGNMFLRLNKETGEAREWQPPFDFKEKEQRGRQDFEGEYLYSYSKETGETGYRFFSHSKGSVFELDLKTGSYEESVIEFQAEELEAHTAGFWEYSEWLPYVCAEGFFQPLQGFLDGRITGAAFDRERQLRAYQKITASLDEHCGSRIHDFIKVRLGEGGTL